MPFGRIYRSILKTATTSASWSPSASSTVSRRAACSTSRASSSNRRRARLTHCGSRARPCGCRLARPMQAMQSPSPRPAAQGLPPARPLSPRPITRGLPPARAISSKIDSLHRHFFDNVTLDIWRLVTLHIRLLGILHSTRHPSFGSTRSIHLNMLHSCSSYALSPSDSHVHAVAHTCQLRKSESC